MIRINKVKRLTKHISYDCKCKFDSRKCKTITRSADVSVKNS